MVRLFGFGITILAFAICTPINAKLTLDGDGKVSAENASQDQIANTEMIKLLCNVGNARILRV